MRQLQHTTANSYGYSPGPFKFSMNVSMYLSTCIYLCVFIYVCLNMHMYFLEKVCIYVMEVGINLELFS